MWLMPNALPVMLTRIVMKSSFMCLPEPLLTNWTIYRFGGPIDVRDRLVKVRQICLTALNEQASCEANKTLSKDTKKYSAHRLKGVTTDLQLLEKQIKELIDSDPHLKSLFENITSIPGVGTVTAAKCIVITDEFKKFDNAKQLACHAGVVPFENSSGTSLQSRPKVSKKAHKGIKATLSNCVMSAMRYNTHFKTYYERNRTADAAQGRKK